MFESRIEWSEDWKRSEFGREVRRVFGVENFILDLYGQSTFLIFLTIYLL